MKRILITVILALAAVLPAYAKDKEYTFTVKVIAADQQVWQTVDRYYATTCNSYRNGVSCYSGEQSGIFDGWKHVANSMIVEASDGRTYQIACTANWVGSKCRKLKEGDRFRARWDSSGNSMHVAYVPMAMNGQPTGGETEAKYDVLQVR